MTNTYVFDTYALLEIIRANKNYEKYLTADVIITNFILAELCYNLIKQAGEKTAIRYTDEYAQFLVDITPDVIKLAMTFRYRFKDKKLSMADCIGYVLALSLGVKFLTGDRQFETLDGVEFVK